MVRHPFVISFEPGTETRRMPHACIVQCRRPSGGSDPRARAGPGNHRSRRHTGVTLGADVLRNIPLPGKVTCGVTSVRMITTHGGFAVLRRSIRDPPVLSIGRRGIASGADYCLDCVANSVDDYYLGHGEEPGQWMGINEVGL